MLVTGFSDYRYYVNFDFNLQFAVETFRKESKNDEK